ncbi:fibronectin type III domain-containing protein [Dyella acidiphila]|uniref:Fibronectin type III domain-containing protein n=1 Tax=Dyella acidiphila TaxID=2775866 RepID=A0ABR9GEJ1_9GAMM|nr:fibronectin type III domain-containing protein [Dyella acidiphila]MBE1162466.1 fibronectin type III domain-containing protein [Dyella acidiphila]
MIHTIFARHRAACAGLFGAFTSVFGMGLLLCLMTLASLWPREAAAYTTQTGCTLTITFNASPLNTQQRYNLTGNVISGTGEAEACSPNGDIQATPGATVSGGGSGNPGDQIAGQHGTYTLEYDSNGNEWILYTPTSSVSTGYTESIAFYGDDGISVVYNNTANITIHIVATAPGAPTIGAATAGNAQASITFTAPGSDGGSPITGYTATSSPGGLTGSCAASPCTVTGLTNGTAYNFTVTATNGVGTGTASAASNSVTPSSVPSAPTGVTASSSAPAQATVTFSAANNNGSAITGYTVTSSPAGGIDSSAGTTSLSHVITGLTNGTPYTFTVTATNGDGTGPASPASNSVTPKATQTITFANPGTQNFGTTPTLTASSNSGLTVTFSSTTTAVCTITTAGQLTFVSAGSCTINADQGGNGVYAAAATVPQTFPVAAVVPGPPTIGTASTTTTQATVTFTAPAFTGGASINQYTATSSPGGLTGTCANTPCVVTGLTYGTAYTFTVTASNSAGTGAPSAASNSVTPLETQTISFSNPGTQNFGTTPTLTATASSGLTVNFSSSTTAVCTITSGGALTFITTGSCTINANQNGNGTYSAAPQVSQQFSVQAVVPGAPTIGAVTTSGQQATVNFTPPAFTGGASITQYTATSSPGGLSSTGCTASPCTVGGLTYGTAYTFTVTATNSAGTGAPSAASSSTTPQNAQTITFSNPGSQNFGTTPTLTATATSSLTVTFTSSTTAVCTITSGGTLTFITDGTCTINANQAGNGTYLPAPQVSQSFNVNAIVPGAPTIGTAAAGDQQATVTFTAPASSGGASITGYTATSSPGGNTSTGCTASPCTVTGLTNGTAYTFTVTATNSAGTGSASAASNAVTPKGSQTITFANPGTQYYGTTPTLTASSTSSLPVSFTSSTTAVCTVTTGGVLTIVTPGSCTINANQAGNNAYLAAAQVSQTFTIAGVAPNPPTIGTATATDAQASVTFTPPTVTGGDAITGYTATSSPGGVTGTCVNSPCTVSGLSNGTAYTFTVTATNAAGTSVASAASNSVTPKVSAQITNFAANPAAPVFKPSGTFTVSATGTGSSSPVVFAVTNPPGSVCSIQGATVTTLSAGTCNVTANQAGDGSHVAAPQATLAVSITNPPPPTVSNASASTNYNTATTVNLSSKIAGIDVTSVAIAQAPQHGTVTVSGQSVTYTPSSTFYGGTDSFTYTATNPGGTSAPATVTVTVVPSAVPVAASHTIATTSGVAVLIQAVEGATGPQPFVGVGVATQPAHGSAAANGEQITYTPSAGFVGTDSFNYVVSNHFGQSQPASITVSVTKAGQASGYTKTVITSPGTPVSVNLGSIVPGTYSGSSLLGLSPGSAGNVSLNQPTALTFTPTGSFTGMVQITAVLSSASGSPVTVDVLVLVTKQPDPSKNPDVLGLINAQTNAAEMFAQSQLDNIRGRLESLHDGGGSLFSSTLSVSLDGKPMSGGGANGLPGQAPNGQPQQPGDAAGTAMWPQRSGFMRPGIGAGEAPDGTPIASSDPSAAPTPTTIVKGGPQGLGVWIGGTANFGTFDSYRQAAGFDSDNIAVTVGVDQRIGNTAVLGMSLGYNHDNSDISNDGTHSIAKGYSAALYGSFAPSANTYIDGVLGGGGLSFDSQRRGENYGDDLLGHRYGDQWFASLTGGYEFKWSSWLVSPYTRLQWSLSSLNAYSETGDVTEALTYGSEQVRTTQAILGLRASGEYKESWGIVIPHFRLELGHNFQGTTDTTLSYAFVPSAGSWNVTTNPYSANGNSVQVGFGSDLRLWSDWLITTEYDFMAQPHAHDQMIKFGLKKQL